VPEIDAAATCGQAVCQILAELLDDLVLNESGARVAADVTGMHKYRVAIRRARAVVGRFRQIMPAEAAAYFSTELRWLGQLTSPLRDTDTQLAALGQYRKWLPAELSSSLGPFYDYLQQTRKSEHEKVVRTLKDNRYCLFVAYWRAFVEKGPADWNNQAWALYAEVAGADIWRLYQSMVRRGRKIGPDAPAEALHQLRKDGKKLRYLIEFFHMGAQGHIAKNLLRQLRRLQDILGDHQDFEVHADMLLKFGEQLALRENASFKDFLALGVLVGRLNGLQAVARGNFAARFRKFSDSGSRRNFRALRKTAEN